MLQLQGMATGDFEKYVSTIVDAAIELLHAVHDNDDDCPEEVTESAAKLEGAIMAPNNA